MTRRIDPDEFARRLRLVDYPLPELLLHHDGDNRCGCLSEVLSAILIDWDDTPGRVSPETQQDVKDQLRECVRNHLGWVEPS